MWCDGGNGDNFNSIDDDNDNVINDNGNILLEVLQQ